MSRPSVKTGLKPHIRVRINQEISPFSSLRGENKPVGNVPESPVLPWVWEKGVRNGENSSQDGLSPVLHRLSTLGLIIVGFELGLYLRFPLNPENKV